MRIRFEDDGGVVGEVAVVDGELSADPWLQSLVDTWTGSAEAFIDEYDGWSNGYTMGRRVE